jgi:hypothetical protein
LNHAPARCPPLAALLLIGCAGQGKSPAWWSLAAVQPGLRVESAQSPAALVEMMVAMKVASERCTGTDALLLRRYRTGDADVRLDPSMLAGRLMGFHYRQAYGDRWWTVLSNDLRLVRVNYENHPDPQRFCRVAGQVARVLDQAWYGSNSSGDAGIAADLWRNINQLHKQMAPDTTTAPVGTSNRTGLR